MSMISLLFLLDERANALNHGPSLFFRELTFKAGHKLALSVFYRVGDLFVGMRLLPLSFGEIGLPLRPPIRQPHAIFAMAYRAFTVIHGDAVRRRISDSS